MVVNYELVAEDRKTALVPVYYIRRMEYLKRLCLCRSELRLQ